MNYKIFLLLILPFLVLACVPIKKEIYLQSADESNVVEDQVVSTYNQKDYQYRLEEGDIVSIKVASATPSEFDFLNHTNTRTITGFSLNDPLLSGFQIEGDGTIPFPVLGKVEIAGLTLAEAREKLQNIVNDYLESPTVDIKLLSFQFTILGEVDREGAYITYNPTFSILDAIGRADGLTNYADRSKVKIIRAKGEVLEVAYVNLLEEDLLSSPYYYLRPGDVITVPPLNAKNWRVNSAANIGLILSGVTAIGIFLNWVL